jgi:nicotinamidase-related amidase
MQECGKFDPQRLLRNERFDAVFLAGVAAEEGVSVA